MRKDNENIRGIFLAYTFKNSKSKYSFYLRYSRIFCLVSVKNHAGLAPKLWVVPPNDFVTTPKQFGNAEKYFWTAPKDFGAAP